MAKNVIKNNGEIELLSQQELEDSLGKVVTGLQQEQARGLSTARFEGIGTISGGVLALPGLTGDYPMGPDTGFAWAVQRISCDGLGTNDVLKVYRNGVTGYGFIDILTAAKPSIRPGGKGVILRSGEQLFVSGTGLTATGDLVVNGEALETSELDLYKLL